MKKELIISSIITVALILIVLISNKQPSANTTTTIPTTQTSTSTAATTSNVTATEVAKHNTVSDCWIIINQSAYNVTSYLNDHPGGSAIVIPFCGKDATVAYNAIKGGRGHSGAATEVLPTFLVGAVQ